MLFFHRDFYLKYYPTFLLSEAELADPEYQQYLRVHDPVPHSGIGYGFMAYSKGLSWYYLRDRSGRDLSAIGKVYDDMIFHLGGGIRLGERQLAKAGILACPLYLRLVNIGSAMWRSILPSDVRKFVRTLFSHSIYHLMDQPRSHSVAKQIRNVKRQMIEDGESYLNRFKK